MFLINLQRRINHFNDFAMYTYQFQKVMSDRLNKKRLLNLIFTKKKKLNKITNNEVIYLYMKKIYALPLK